MSYRKQKNQNYYLQNTSVENLFLGEYMPIAPGEYVKVYLYALMYAENGVRSNNAELARQLGMAVEDVLKAWTYWEGKGIIRKINKKSGHPLEYGIEFVSLKEQLYCRPSRQRRRNDSSAGTLTKALSDASLKKLYRSIEQATGRLLEGKEPLTILGWLDDYRVGPEVITFAYQHCAQTKNNTKPAYVHAVLKSWVVDQNLKTVEEIQGYLNETDQRHYQYKRILKSLGCYRNATEEEQRIINSWFDDHGLSLNEILTACNKTSGITNPNINYVNAVLTGNNKTFAGSRTSRSRNEVRIEQVMQAYEDDKRRNEEAAAQRRAEVYKEIPRIEEIDKLIVDVDIELSRVMLRGGGDRKAAEMRKRGETLQAEKAYLLTDHNYPPDYMEVKYNCSLCSDTGTLESGERCSCFTARLAGVEKKI